jgi:hypothetical protein
VITRAPARPGPTREDVPNSAPVVGATFEIANEKEVVSSFVTDEQGRFRVSLQPGHYSVRIKKGQMRRCGPFEVEVVSGKMTTVEWRCDTGMR